MSRVYEALKRAENQQPADTVGKRANAQSPAIVRTPWPDGTLPRPEPALAKLESALPASAAQVRGPALVVGRSEPQYRKVVEQFHLLAVGLQNWSEEQDKRVFMLTSALSGEGKSFMALNLAASLARIGNRVVLVDADLRSPTLHRAFNLTPMSGLVSYLAGETEFQACLQTTQIPGLFLVPAGGTSYTPTETLARPRMREFVQEATRYGAAALCNCRRSGGCGCSRIADSEPDDRRPHGSRRGQPNAAGLGQANHRKSRRHADLRDCA